MSTIVPIYCEGGR